MINKQKIYVAGPYSKGDVIINMQQAVLIGDRLLDYGFIPFIPHLTGFWHFLSPRSYESWMEYDSEWLKSCDALLRLDGESDGADRETKWAIQKGIPVFFDTTDLVHWFQEHN